MKKKNIFIISLIILIITLIAVIMFMRYNKLIKINDLGPNTIKHYASSKK